MKGSGRSFLPAPSHLLPIVSMLLPNLVNAVEWEIRPRFEVGAMYYKFDQEDRFIGGLANEFGGFVGISFMDFAVEDVLPSINGGVTFYADRFFLDVSAGAAFGGNDSISEQRVDFQEGQERDFGFVNKLQQADVEWDRHEFSITAGFDVTGNDNITLYVGYKLAETDFGISEKDISENDLVRDEVMQSYKSNFSENGFFIGGTLSYPVGKAGALGIRAALAFLDGEIDYSGSGKGTFFEKQTRAILPFTYVINDKDKGDTVGITVGLSWQGAITAIDGLFYTISAEGYRYNFDAEIERGLGPPERFGGDTFAEIVGKFSVGISYGIAQEQSR